MALAALDPWALEFEQEHGEDDLRIEALERFAELVDSHPDLEPLRFVGADYYNWFWSRFSQLEEENPAVAAYFLPLEDLSRYLARLERRETMDLEPVHELEAGAGASIATRSWQRAVAAVVDSDEGPNWRNPVLFIHSHRTANWPGLETSLPLPDTVAAGVASVQRLVVTVDQPDANELFVRDFDPWKCECARQVETDRCARNLPRPASCARLPMREWQALLRETSDAVSDRLHFVPPTDWDPTAIAKKQWRDCPFGSHEEKFVKKIGRKKGPKDRRGRIWDWDDAHKTHWDVQHESPHDRRRLNVTPDGRVTRGYDD